MHTLIVGEIGINANGDIEIAKKLIDVCSNLGIPYIKFQKRNINLCYTQEFLDSHRESSWGKTQRAQKEGLEFSLEQYQEIDKYCKLKNIKWFASPWDLESIDFICNNFPDMPFLKIPSAKMTDKLFLRKCDDTGIPLILSTGMCTMDIIREAMNICKNAEYLLHCTSTYPCKDEDLNLIQIKMLRYYFETEKCKIGFSNHSPSIIFMPEAVLLGAAMIETHITLDRSSCGSDQAASIEPSGLQKAIKYIEGTEKAIGDIEKRILDSEIPIIKKLRGD